MKKVFMISMVILFLYGCGWWVQDFDKSDKRYQKISLHLLTIGNSKAEVATLIGAPDNVIGSKKYDSSIIEVWSYEKWHGQMGPDYLEEVYWLYFLDGKLQQWGRPGDWQKEADKIYEFRFR